MLARPLSHVVLPGHSLRLQPYQDMIIPRWRSVCSIKNSLITPTSATSNSSAFHSTPISYEKWNGKLNFDFQKVQKPSKNYIKFTTREKRASAKKALKNLLFNSGSSETSFKGNDPIWKFDGREADRGKRGKSKSSARSAAKSQHKKAKGKFRREIFSEDLEDHPEIIFQEAFRNSWYTWSFNSWRSDFESSTSGFQRGEDWDKHKFKNRKTLGDLESSDESFSLGSPSDRITLGLPPRGPLKIEDVKNAFRISAFKWHPDKHQGPSQSAAEEKFKLCVNAYKSLCSAFSAA